MVFMLISSLGLFCVAFIEKLLFVVYEVIVIRALVSWNFFRVT